MSNYLIFTLASNHSGDFVSLIGRLPFLNCENVAGKSAVVIRSMSCLSVFSTLSTVRFVFVVLEWFDFHLKLFPSGFSFSICSLVDYGIVPICILLHFVVGRSCFRVLFYVGCTNALICFFISTKFSF